VNEDKQSNAELQEERNNTATSKAKKL